MCHQELLTEAGLLVEPNVPKKTGSRSLELRLFLREEDEILTLYKQIEKPAR